MRDFFSSRFFAVVAIALLICFGVALYTGASNSTTPATDGTGLITSPLQKGITVVANKVADGYNYMFKYQAMEEENKKLKQKVSDMEQTVRDAKVALDENTRLRELLGIRERHRSFQFELAEVIGRNPGNWATTLTIDKGSQAGIKVDDCVITEDGMVGYVSSVGTNFAEVTTVIDVDMQAGALISRTREIAVAEGDFSLMEKNSLKLSYLKKDADVVIGDTVETSGRGGVYPKGLMIGTVERIIPEEHGASNYAVVKPFVSVDSIKNVFIIKSFDLSE